MLQHVPWYILLGEALIGAGMPPLIAFVASHQQWWKWILAGVAGGAWIGVSYFIAYSLVGR